MNTQNSRPAASVFARKSRVRARLQALIGGTGLEHAQMLHDAEAYHLQLGRQLTAAMEQAIAASEGQRGASGAQQAGRVLTGNVAHILTQFRQECAARNAANGTGS